MKRNLVKHSTNKKVLEDESEKLVNTAIYLEAKVRDLKETDLS